MSSPTSPLTFLPIEMKRAILSFCDGATLAKACLGSLSFLELASPFLYGDILIHGLQHFERLFYEKKSPSSAPHLDHHFSLSQLQSLTFLGVQNDSFKRNTFNITTSRLPSPSPLQIKTLKVRFGRHDESKRSNPLPLDLYSSIFSLFDSEHVMFFSPSGGKSDQRLPFPLTLELDNWTRIRTWSWSNVVLANRHFRRFFIGNLAFLSNLPDGSLTISFDIRTNRSNGLTFEQACTCQVTGVRSADWDALLSCEKVREVVFRASSQEQVTRVRGVIVDTLKHEEPDDELRRTLLEMVHFEVDERSSGSTGGNR